jgi:excisionase family DNA binding protein
VRASVAEDLDLHIPTEQEQELATKSARVLSPLVTAAPEETRVQLVRTGEVVALPNSAMRLFVDLLGHMGRGDAVRLVAVNAELSTQQAADLLNVSRPYLISLLDEGKLEYRKVGRHRRIPARAALAYKDATRARSAKLLDEMAEEAQALGLDDI